MNRTMNRLVIASSLLAALVGCSQPNSTADVPDVTVDATAADGTPNVATDVATDSPTPSGIGRACEGSTQVEQGDCEEGQICLPREFGFPEGYCTSDCRGMRCPSGSTCVPLGGQFSACLLNCNVPSDCRVSEGYRCEASRSGRRVCTPTDGPTGNRDGAACFTTTAGPHQLPALARRTFAEPNVSVSRERSDTMIQAEGNVAVSPTTGAVAVSYIAVGRGEAFMGVSARLADGTVHQTGTVRDPELQTTSDPVLAYMPDGQMLMVFLGYNVNAQGQPTGMRIRLTSSADDGRMWEPARAIEPLNFCAGGCDKPWIVIGPTPRAVLEADAGVPVVDSGVPVIDAGDIDGENSDGGEPDGTVADAAVTDAGAPDSGVSAGSGVSIYVGFMAQSNRGQTVTLYVVRSDDGGRTFTAPLRFATSGGTIAPNLLTPAVSADGTLHVVYAGLFAAGGSTTRFGDPRSRVFYRNSMDGGATWSTVTIASRSTDSPVYGQPVVVADGSRVHVAFVSGTVSGAWDVVLATSGDLGMTWAHRKINDEPEPCASHAFPWIVADPARSRVHALWLENRFGDGAAAYASCPSDPTMPCARNERVDDGSFTFETSREPGRWHGDYQGLALAPDGALWATWSDTRTGSPAMYLSRGLVR
ncbi:MAG: sialidase family protein [Deltaproteobacteria bacterium]|nr:sialidase family protein [Deltaproteobacteria bacterium]